ncbi:PREDICTED: protein SET DOMAIN GROUP 41 isoform X2 [Lupinus angustifolius]|uniref:protein SET DOMAIN GROUP 41 isoform X2 n=1 Tax=Lupinus angustifolius TaxID=3871 RepID=UPI00092E9E53|nr:PREDICTED: protein SET DOMAIN GROUP 41 isoform X2 [Lupinus angustifolius]
MEIEMEMRATEDIDISTDITPPLIPLSFSPFNSSLNIHPSPDLSTSLRLLLHHRPTLTGRIAGLLSNRHKLTSQNDQLSHRIRADAQALAAEIAKQCGDTEPNDCVLEEAIVALCAVLTNAVEVQDNEGRNIGVAVFGSTFSWINHSCSPNACYRFTFSSSHSSSNYSESKLRIAPFFRNSQQVDDGVWCDGSEFAKEGEQSYGPRLIVRSIKRIKKGEEVTVAYTDLLQPKAIRQSELWSKYRFNCCCKRCSALPFTYVDHALQEISVSSHDLSGSCLNSNFIRDMVDRRLNEDIDDAISEYLSVGDPETCCKKLEKVLIQGLNDQLEGFEGKSNSKFMLHPLNHLSLNAYTTLASAYKVRASNSLSVHSEVDQNQLEAFDLSRISAAYSLLLAGSTHHLFNYEPSLIASVANFWMGAGESLLSLTRSSRWSEFVKVGEVASDLFSVTKFKCSKCSLIDRFRTCILNGQIRSADFENMSNEFLRCVSDITQKVWSFLVNGYHFLKSCKDPIDFSLLMSTKNSGTMGVKAHVNKTDISYSHGSENCVQICKEQAYYADHARANIFQLGLHCLVYGGLLAIICYGHNSHLACHVQTILDHEESFV